MERFDRTTKLIGSDKVQLLQNSKVAVFGVGGVGSYVVEALARAGVGKLMLVDSDVVDITNINRQLVALTSTIGQPKVEVATSRAKDINPNIVVDARQTYFDKNTINDFSDLQDYDYIVDAIDSVTSKLLLVEYATQHNIKIISCMGTGNKLDPTRFEVADISKTEYCPLAKVMRKELKSRGINHLKVVYSKEQPHNCDGSTNIPASISFVPSVAGLILAGQVIKDLTN